MKRKILMWFIATFMPVSVLFAQTTNTAVANSDGAFSKGDVSLNIASGFGVAFDYYGSYVSLPALSVGIDVGVWDNVGPGCISVGGIVGFKKAFNDNDGYDAQWTNILIAGRGTYHLKIVKNDRFDPYGGVTTGVRIYDYHDSYFDDKNNPNTYNSVYPVIGLFAGAKYNFTPGFGGYAEFAYDISFIRVGLCFNF